MIRVSSDDICGLLNLDQSTPVFHAIIAANTVVESTLMGTGLSESQLEQIELMLAGHFYRLGNPEVSAEKYADASFNYALAKREAGFAQTSWGQMALTLDTSGTLRNLEKQRASLIAL